MTKTMTKGMKCRALYAGLTFSHAAIPLSAFALLVGLLGFTEGLMQKGAFSWLPLKYVLRSDYDPFIYLTHQIAELNWEGRKNSYLFLGGSSLRECVEDPDTLADELSRAIKKPISIEFLVSTQQNWGETMALVEKLPRNGATLVLGVNPSRFSRSPAEYLEQLEGRRLGITSRRLEQFMARRYKANWTWQSLLPFLSRWVGSWIWIQNRELRQFKIPSHRYPDHVYDESTRLSLERKWQFFHRHVEKRMMTKYYNHADFNFEALQQVISYAKGRGFLVVLMELPLLRDFEAPLKGVLDRYRPRLTAIAKSEKVPYWNFAHALPLEEADFSDVFHLLPSGRQKFEPVLLTYLKRRERSYAPIL